MLLKFQICQGVFQSVNQPCIWFFCRYEISSLLWSFPDSSDALDFVHNLLFYLSPNDDQYHVHLHRHPWQYRLFILILELHPFNCPLLHFSNPINECSYSGFERIIYSLYVVPRLNCQFMTTYGHYLYLHLTSIEDKLQWLMMWSVDTL